MFQKEILQICLRLLTQPEKAMIETQTIRTDTHLVQIWLNGPIQCNTPVVDDNGDFGTVAEGNPKGKLEEVIVIWVKDKYTENSRVVSITSLKAVIAAYPPVPGIPQFENLPIEVKRIMVMAQRYALTRIAFGVSDLLWDAVQFGVSESKKYYRYTADDIHAAIAFGFRQYLQHGHINVEQEKDFLKSLDKVPQYTVETEERPQCETCQKQHVWHCAHPEECGARKMETCPNWKMETCPKFISKDGGRYLCGKWN